MSIWEGVFILTTSATCIRFLFEYSLPILVLRTSENLKKSKSLGKEKLGKNPGNI